MTAFERIVDALREHGSTVKDGHGKATAQCPAHDDNTASLSIGPRNDGEGVVICCQAGCDYLSVLAALNLTASDLWDEPKLRDVYKPNQDYRYRGGRVKMRRTSPDTGKKRFTQEGADDKSLYAQEKLTDEHRRVVLVESEKSADMLWALGIAAVATGGANCVCDVTPLTGLDIVLVVDRDPAGDKWEQRQREALTGVAAAVHSTWPAVSREHADIADHIEAGYSLDELEPYEPAQLGSADTNGHGEYRGNRDGWLSDSNISELFVKRVLDGKYCWTNGLGWMRWDGKKWLRTTHEDVVEQSRLFAITLVAEVAHSADPDKIRLCTRRMAASAVRAAADLAKGQLLADADVFDQHPDLLNVANGVVNLRTGELGPHDSALLLTKCAPTNYRRDAQHPDWTAAAAALPQDVRDWMQLRLGQAITGYPTPDDVLTVAHGAGENGKTTITGGVLGAIGEYATVVPDRVLLANPNDHPTELMTLRGARLALLEETPEARHLNIKRLKDVLGTTRVTARYIRRDSVSWSPTHSLFVSTNYRPRVEETDHGTWRRLALVTFPYTYRKDKLDGVNDRRADPTLRDRVETSPDGQHEAILAWLVDGAMRWYAAGRVMPPPPDTVAHDTRLWRHESDLILRWSDDNLIADPRFYVPSKAMFDDFAEWLKANGHQKWSSQTFAERFGQHDEIKKRAIFHDRVYGELTKLEASWPNAGFEPLPERFRAWIGVRYRTKEDDLTESRKIRDQQEHESGTCGTDGLGKPTCETLTRGLPKPSVPSVPRRSDSADSGPSSHATAFVAPAGADRCQDCGFHVPTQRHRDHCPANPDNEPLF